MADIVCWRARDSSCKRAHRGPGFKFNALSNMAAMCAKLIFVVMVEPVYHPHDIGLNLYNLVYMYANDVVMASNKLYNAGVSETCSNLLSLCLESWRTAMPIIPRKLHKIYKKFCSQTDSCQSVSRREIWRFLKRCVFCGITKLLAKFQEESRARNCTAMLLLLSLLTCSSLARSTLEKYEDRAWALNTRQRYWRWERFSKTYILQF